MKILKTQVLRGPNIWSNYRKKLIQMRLDLEEMENFPTDKLPGFKERLETLLPAMVEHECSEGIMGGFFMRLKRGTWLGHVLEHVALEIQTLAGMETGYGRTRGTAEKGVYNLVFSYTIEEAGLYAAQAAFRIVDSLSKGENYDLTEDIDELKRIHAKNILGPSTNSIVEEAAIRGIPWTRTGSNSSIQLGYGRNQKQFQATITCNTGLIAVNSAANKETTKRLLAKAKIPVAAGAVCDNEKELQEAIDKIGYPIVIKPLDGNQGKGASINVCDWESAKAGLEFALKYRKDALVEKFVSGFDFRFLVIDNKFVAAAKRVPAFVKGDGMSTINELIEIVNSDPKRGNGHQNLLTRILVDRDTQELLAKNSQTLESIPASGEIIYLKSTANLSTGGTAIDVTDIVHPENIFLAERISRVIGLDVCGVDIMAQNITEPIRENGGVVLEVNAAPGFRMHIAPSEGKSRNVATAVVDMLYPPGTPSRIPIIAVTGTNGKTTTTRLLAHIAKNNGFNVGYTTTDGIYINDYIVEEGDTTGPLSAAFVLSDPTVEFAVLETARGGILRSGLSFDECDIAIITNIKEDHLGLSDINTLEDLANVKAVVARSVKRDGWAVLNGQDINCRQIADELDCNVAYFTLDENEAFIKEQVSSGKTAAVYENGYITILKGNEKIRIENVLNVPITFGGGAKFMIANALAATLAGYLWGFSTETIRQSLQTFMPSLAQTPGRLNHFAFKNFNVVVDYAHNPHGYSAIEEYLSSVTAVRKIGIISGIGDRRDEDIKECALIACRMFDHIIIRQEHNLRGRTEENINALLLQGIMKSRIKVSYEFISEENDAIHQALLMATNGDLIVALSDNYRSVIDIIEKEMERESFAKAVEPAKQNKPLLPQLNINHNSTYHGRTA